MERFMNLVLLKNIYIGIPMAELKTKLEVQPHLLYLSNILFTK